MLKAMCRSKLAAASAWALGACIMSNSVFAGDGYNPFDNVTYSIVTISGGEFSNGAQEGYSGAYFAFNRDFSRDGVIGRIYGSFGRYDHEFDDGYDHVNVDGEYWSGDLMIGYLWVRGGLDFSVLVGGDYQGRKAVALSTDPFLSDRDREDEFGFKVFADIESNGNGNSPIYFNLGGSYSTAFDTYYALGRLGYRFDDRFTLGPEAWALGDDSGDVQRVGGFVNLDFEMGTVAGMITVSGGYQFSDQSFAGEFGEEGGYATVELRMALGEHRSPLK